MAHLGNSYLALVHNSAAARGEPWSKEARLTLLVPIGGLAPSKKPDCTIWSPLSSFLPIQPPRRNPLYSMINYAWLRPKNTKVQDILISLNARPKGYYNEFLWFCGVVKTSGGNILRERGDLDPCSFYSNYPETRGRRKGKISDDGLEPEQPRSASGDQFPHGSPP